MQKGTIAVCLLIVWAVLFAPSNAQAAGEPNLILIFDASGSMWGQIDGKPKITIAKEAMDLIVNDLPPKMNVGLVAYGHRRKGDCDDVETLIPLGPLDANAFMSKINALNPKGKTPMVRSLKQTAEAIKHLEDETTILLVSDGEETCDPDPCAFVAELEKLGIKFVLHIVGFDVGGQTEAQLKCMAKAGGGEYFPAKDASKLKQALDTVIEKTVEKNLMVSVFLNGKPIGALVEVTDPNTGKRTADRSSSEPKPLLLSVAPGTYTVTVTDEWAQEGRPKQVVENVVITDTEQRELTVNFGSGKLLVWTYNNGKPFKGRVLVTTLEGETVGGGYATTNPDKPAQYLLPPGQYKMMAEDSWGTGAQLDFGIIELVAGQTIEKKALFDTGKLVVWLFKNGKPMHGSVLVKDKNGTTMGGGWGTTQEDRPAEYDLLPGVYSLKVEDSWGEPVVMLDCGLLEIKAGQTLKKTCDFDNPPTPAPPAPTSSAPAVSGAAASSGQAVPQAATAGSPKQTARETVVQAPSQQDMAAQAAQMEAMAQAQAAQAQADAMAQIQTAMGQMPSMETPQTPAQQAAASGASAREATENPREVSLPQVADSQAGYSIQQPTVDDHGAQGDPNHLGARPSTIDYSQVGAVDTGGGLTEADERPEQGVNPYEGMSEKEMQAAFARDMSMQGPQGGAGYNPDELKVGSPLDTKRHITTLGYRLDSCEERASVSGRSDILSRIKTARGNLAALGQQLKQRVSKDMLQQTLDRCAQEIKAIQISVAQGQ